MKIVALALLNTSTGFADRSPNHRDDRHLGGLLRGVERRRKPRACIATPKVPSARLATGLAVQVIAQNSYTPTSSDQIQAARAAYQAEPSTAGAYVNCKA